MNDQSRTKSNLHYIIEALPEKETIAAEKFLRFLISELDDPVMRLLLTAEEVDEPLTEEEIAESEDGWREYLRGETEPLKFEDIKKLEEEEEMEANR